MDNHTPGNGPSNDHPPIPPSHLLMALLCPLSVALVSYGLNLQLERKILIAVSRCCLQLFLAGYVLLGFIFSIRNPFAVLLYLFLMTLIAALEATSRTSKSYSGHFTDALLSVLTAGGIFGITCSVLVFAPNPWWEPQILVPTCGMIIGNSISGPSVAVDKFLSFVTEQKHEVETRLAFGATSYEASVAILRSCILTALTPILNMMSVAGIVSIPGMMTGQLIGGASPLVAAEYQMSIFWIMCTTNFTAIIVALTLSSRHAVIDSSHRLTTEKIVKSDTKGGIEVAFYRVFTSIYSKLQTSTTSIGLPSVIISSQRNGLYEAVPAPGNTDKAEEFASNDVGIASIAIATNEKLSTNGLGPIVLEVNALNIMSNSDMLFDVSGLSFQLRKGERISMEGPSGLGKTRLLRAIAKLDQEKSGMASLVYENQSNSDHNRLASSSLSVNGSGRSKSNDDRQSSFQLTASTIHKYMSSFYISNAIPSYRTRCIYVPQALPPMAASPKAFISEYLSFAARVGDFISSESRQQCLNRLDEICKNMANSLGLAEDKFNKDWSTLSGGERQRAIIGCALIAAMVSNDLTVSSPTNHPVIILLDEPTAACDAASRDLVERAIVSSGVTAIIITHDAAQADRICHRRLIFHRRMNGDANDRMALAQMNDPC